MHFKTQFKGDYRSTCKTQSYNLLEENMERNRNFLDLTPKASL